MIGGNVVNKLHNYHGLANTGTAEKADLSSLRVRGEKVHDLYSSDENLLGLALLGEKRCGLVDRSLGLGGHVSLLVHAVADHVKDPTEGLGAHGNLGE